MLIRNGVIRGALRPCFLCKNGQFLTVFGA